MGFCHKCFSFAVWLFVWSALLWVRWSFSWQNDYDIVRMANSSVHRLQLLFMLAVKFNPGKISRNRMKSCVVTSYKPKWNLFFNLSSTHFDRKPLHFYLLGNYYYLYTAVVDVYHFWPNRWPIIIIIATTAEMMNTNETTTNFLLQ